MKPPPFLLGAALLFWGWQSDLFGVGALMAVALEGSRVFKSRWDFSDDDFRRVWQLCTLLFLGGAVYAFTTNEGPSAFGSLLQDPTVTAQRDAGLSSARTAAALFRWLPIIFYPFILTQMFSTRETVPLTAVSVLARRRARQAAKVGKKHVERELFIGYPFFATCLVGASVHPTEDRTFFWGTCALMAWVLWSHRSRRFSFAVWLATFATATALGFFGQNNIGPLQRYLENLNPPWLARLMRRNLDPTRSATAIGKIGELKLSGEIVIRVEPRTGPVPSLLREATYQRYKNEIWNVRSFRRGGDRSSSGDWPGFQAVPEDKPLPSRAWTLSVDSPKISVVNIACYLPGGFGLLPLPHGCGRLEELPAYLVRRNDLGTLLAQGPPLVIFDALSGPHSTVDAPPEIPPDPLPTQLQRAVSDDVVDPDHNVPIREQAAVDTVIEEAQLRGLPMSLALDRLNNFFAAKFTYSTWQATPTGPGKDQTPMSRFLLTTRSGHCEYFATATVFILRQLGFYARYATGYAVNEKSGTGYIVRQRDAHAWCLVWDPDKKSWFDYDTTPPDWVAEEARHASAWQWLGDAWARLRFEIAKLRYGQSNLQTYLLWIILPALIIVLYQIVFRSGRRKKLKSGAADSDFTTWPGLDSEFYQLEKRLALRGFPRQDGEPVSHWLERVIHQIQFQADRASLETLLRLHYRYRFDPLGLGESDRETLRRETRTCLEQLAPAQKARAVMTASHPRQ